MTDVGGKTTLEMLGVRLRTVVCRRLSQPGLSTRVCGALSQPVNAGIHAVARRAGFVLDQRGASAVEFAIVAPLFLVLVLALLAYGIYLGSVHSVEQLAADAARASIAGLSDAERIQIATAHVATNTPDYPLLDVTKVTVVAGPSTADPSQFRVSVRFDSSNLPIWVVAGLVPMPDPIIVRTTVIKRGGY